jgi:hypothetical protein
MRCRGIRTEITKAGNVHFPQSHRISRRDDPDWNKIAPAIMKQLQNDRLPEGSVADVLVSRYGLGRPLTRFLGDVWRRWAYQGLILLEVWNSFESLPPCKYENEATSTDKLIHSCNHLSGHVVACIETGAEMLNPEIFASMKAGIATPQSKAHCLGDSMPQQRKSIKHCTIHYSPGPQSQEDHLANFIFHDPGRKPTYKEKLVKERTTVELDYESRRLSEAESEPRLKDLSLQQADALTVSGYRGSGGGSDRAISGDNKPSLSIQTQSPLATVMVEDLSTPRDGSRRIQQGKARPRCYSCLLKQRLCDGRRPRSACKKERRQCR